MKTAYLRCRVHEDCQTVSEIDEDGNTVGLVVHKPYPQVPLPQELGLAGGIPPHTHPVPPHDHGRRLSWPYVAIAVGFLVWASVTVFAIVHG